MTARQFVKEKYPNAIVEFKKHSNWPYNRVTWYAIYTDNILSKERKKLSIGGQQSTNEAWKNAKEQVK